MYKQMRTHGAAALPWNLAPLFALALLFVAAPAGAAAAQSVRDEVGWTSLAERLGGAVMPDGRGVRVGQVEVGLPGEYAPGSQDPEFAGLAIHATSGPSTPSQHATRVGACLYGRESGLAPGVEAVDAWEVLDWLGTGFLNGPGREAPHELGLAVLNHSWVGDVGPSSGAYLRKLDAVIAQQGLFVVSGTSNGAGRLSYPLVAHAYNGVSVGRADGCHTAGGTLSWIDGPGRMKPELVAPALATSYAAPLVSGAAALLLQTAREHPRLAGNPRALEPVVLKAVLMAGARHRQRWWNGAFELGALRGVTERPLDPVYGVDLLDIDASHWLLTAGEAPSAPQAADAPLAKASGWVRLELAAGESQWVRVRIERESPFASVIATWNRQVSWDFERYEMPNVDLELYSLDGRGEPQSLVGPGGVGRFLGGNVASYSRVDNLEHLHVTGLAPGEYVMRVHRGFDGAGAWPVALAWRFAAPGPLNYGVSKTTSIGTTPKLQAAGLPESFGSGVVLEFTGGMPNELGIVLESHDSAELPFRGGTLFVRTPVDRSTCVRLDGRGAVRLRVEANAGSPADVNPARGRRCFQVLFRDPGQADGSAMGHSAGLALSSGAPSFDE